MIDPDIFSSLALAKAVLDEHCRIVAAEEPRILTHHQQVKMLLGVVCSN